MLFAGHCHCEQSCWTKAPNWHVSLRIVDLRIVWRLERIKLRQPLRHATRQDKLGAHPKFRAHHQLDHLL
jgi:hypothetical protein